MSEFVTGQPITIRGFHATDREIEGDLYPDTWFTNKSEAADFYYSGDQLGFKYEADVVFQNPLVVSQADWASTTHGPPYWLDQAHQRGHDGVIIPDIVDGNRESTVFCPIIGQGATPDEFFAARRIRVLNAPPETDLPLPAAEAHCTSTEQQRTR